MRRIVVDTNCLLMCVSPMSKYHEVWSEFLKGEVEWCVSNEILSEYMEIMERKTSPWLAEAVVNVILNNERTVRVTPSFYFNLIEADPDDNKFVDCAVCGNADLIVSNDSHFSVLANIKFPKVRVVRIEEYKDEIRI